MQKQRLDVFLAENGMAKSRSEAQSLIKSGNVFVDGRAAAKSGESVSGDESIEIRGERCAYVSRGGLKLEKAVRVFEIDLAEKVCMDIGASTGGFTDCMLKGGAKKVYAVDVGRDQLDKSLADDERVVNMEQTNIRYLDNDTIDDDIGFFSVDVSFISLTMVLPKVSELLSDSASGVCLIKPQFEAGRENIGKKGVVRSPEIHREVIQKIFDFARNIGFGILGLNFSPIRGPEGNIVYLMYLSNGGDTKCGTADIDEVVRLSHSGAV